MDAASYTSLDNALEVLAGCGIALKNGNSNHAPMVAEALCATGRPDAVMPWVARYRDNILPRPASGRPVSRDDWRSALGQRDRFLFPGKRAPPGVMPGLAGQLSHQDPIGLRPRSLITHSYSVADLRRYCQYVRREGEPGARIGYARPRPDARRPRQHRLAAGRVIRSAAESFRAFAPPTVTLR